jgi:hypothetical protein
MSAPPGVPTRTPTPSIPLLQPQPTIDAVALDERHIRCGMLFVTGPHPIAEICARLVCSLPHDCALQVWNADGSPAFRIGSVFATGRIR